MAFIDDLIAQLNTYGKFTFIDQNDTVHAATQFDIKTANGTTTVWKAGNNVTYLVDSGVSYTEEVDNGASVLSPTTFTPTKSGYTFVGWRKDKTASSSVLTSAVMDGNPITLYAVFSKDITVTYYNATSKAATTTGKQYYNNGNVSNPKFTIEQLASPTWESRGWGTNSKGNADVVYDSISDKEFATDTTIYALYQRDITLSYNGNGSTSGSVTAQTGTRYWNSAGNYVNPSFTLAANGFTKSEYRFVAWASGSASGTQYAADASVTLSANTTFYAVWTEIIYSYNVVSNSAVQSGASLTCVNETNPTGNSDVNEDYSYVRLSGAAIIIGLRNDDSADHDPVKSYGYVYTNSMKAQGQTITIKNTFTAGGADASAYTGLVATVRVRNVSTSAVTNLGSLTANGTNTFTMPTDRATYRLEIYVEATSTSVWNCELTYQINTLTVA